MRILSKLVLAALICTAPLAACDRAEEHAGTIMPCFTHLQTAQPITFGHHLLSYVEMIGRDRSRFADCRARLNESPLGAAALAGNIAKAREFNDRLLGLHQHLFCEANPIPVKWAAQQMGLVKSGIRLPLTPLSPVFHDRVRNAMRQAGIAA